MLRVNNLCENYEFIIERKKDNNCGLTTKMAKQFSNTISHEYYVNPHIDISFNGKNLILGLIKKTFTQ